MKVLDIINKPLTGEWGTDEEDSLAKVPVLRTTNFNNDGHINYDKIAMRTIAKTNIKEKFLQGGDILIEKSGGSIDRPVGRVVFLMEKMGNICLIISRLYCV